MKTWEMIKKLTESPEKEFKSTNGIIATAEEEGYLNLKGSIYKGNYNFLGLEWEEVKKPVDFITAVESRKMIKIVHPEITANRLSNIKNYNHLDDILYLISREFTNPKLSEILLNAEFYIMD